LQKYWHIRMLISITFNYLLVQWFKKLNKIRTLGKMLVIKRKVWKRTYFTWETSATRFLLLGSSIGGVIGRVGDWPRTILPNMVPFSVITFVNARVSISHIPGTFCSFIQSDNVLVCLQWLGFSQISPTTSPAAQIRWDSNQLRQS